MASSLVSHKCSADRECKKNGTIKCDGCSLRFCAKHFTIHRQQLDARLELLCSDRDTLHESIQMSRDPTGSLSEIDLWEQKTIVHVKTVADNARQRIRELSSTADNNLAFLQFSEELRRRKENDDYIEQDIERLSQHLDQIKIESKKIVQINISYVSIDWSTIIGIDRRKQKQSDHGLFYQTSLLTSEQQRILNSFCQKDDQQWQLIYRATQDGFGEKAFVRHCANQGPTMTVILVEDYLFGGFTSASWEDATHVKWSDDSTAFLFTLINPHEIPPTKYPIKSSGKNAIRSSAKFGPTFGCFDICIHKNANSNLDSNCAFPKSYQDVTELGCKTFTGTSQFTIREIEVYKQV